MHPPSEGGRKVVTANIRHSEDVQEFAVIYNLLTGYLIHALHPIDDDARFLRAFINAEKNGTESDLSS